MDWLGKKLGVVQLEDWYKVSRDDVKRYDSGDILKIYGSSFILALEANYPEHQWKPWLFDRLPYGWWKHAENQRKFLESLGKEMGFKNMDDYYLKLKTVDIEKAGGSGLLRQYGDSIGR